MMQSAVSENEERAVTVIRQNLEASGVQVMGLG